MMVFPDDIAKQRLAQAAAQLGRSVEDLATAAIEEAALGWARDNGFPGESKSK